MAWSFYHFKLFMLCSFFFLVGEFIGSTCEQGKKARITAANKIGMSVRM